MKGLITHLYVTSYKNWPFKFNILLRQDMYLSTLSIHGLPIPSIVNICEVSSFLFLCIVLTDFSVHAKNSNAYNSTCIKNIALKLQSVVPQVLTFYE